MKALLHSISLGAGAAALLALSACQSQESPTSSDPVTADKPVQSLEGRMLSEGRKATEAEVARYLAARKDAPSVNLADSPAPLAKAAALPTCLVNFNQVNALDRLPDDGYRGYSFGPTHYAHSCNASYYTYANPFNTNQYRLTPEHANWCSVAPNRIGTLSNGVCANQNQAIYFPRKAGNVGGNTGVQFIVRNTQNVQKYFDLQAIYINSGTAEIVANRPDFGWWVWYPLSAGTRWYWPAGTIVSEIRVFDQGQNGTVVFDNLEIAIHP